MEDSTKASSNSKKFMIKFFAKLKAKDFKSDQFLFGFYKAYEKGKMTQQSLTVFDFYMEYLLRNKNYDVAKKTTEMNRLCDNIKKAIFDPPVDSPTMADVKGNEKPASKMPITKTNGNSKTVKLNKKFALLTLSDFIKSSCIITYENPEEVRTQHDEDFRVNTTKNIVEEIKTERGELPIAHKDAAFNRRNDMLEIWRDTEHKCIKFIENDIMANILRKVYFIDGSQITLHANTPITTLSCDDISQVSGDEKKSSSPVIPADDDDMIPCETIMPSWSHAYYKTIVTVLPTDALTETMHRNKKKIKCALLCAGSQMIPGGSADQGIETNESILYYASSYNLCINQLIMAYPLASSQLLVLPNILVFKDHTKQRYPMLPPIDGQKISVIMTPSIYRPETTIDNQDKYNIDDRLYLPSTRYKNPNIIIDQLKATFNTALFFGYDTIVLDDRGIEDFWLPAHHTAQLLAQVISQYKGKFHEIIVAIEKKHLFNVYKKYIN